MQVFHERRRERSDSRQVFYERRRERSDSRREALALQLRACARDAGIEALVLADHRGQVIARSDLVADADEIAAFCPFLARPKRWRGQVRCHHGTREVAITPFRLGNRTAYLCALGTSRRAGGALLRATAGVRRIMGA
jgi:hypothetical protein